MEKSSFTSSFSSRFQLAKIPRVLILSLTLILVLEFAVCNLPTAAWDALFTNSSPARDDALRFRAKLELMTEAKPKILLLGSSQMRAGVNTLIVQDSIKKLSGISTQVVNLGMTGARSLDFFLQLRPALSKSPTIVVLMPTWNFAFDDSPQQRIKYYSYSLSDMLEVASVYGWEILLDHEKRGHFIDGILVNLMPSYRFVRSYSIFRILAKMYNHPRTKPRFFVYRKMRPDSYFEQQISRLNNSRMTMRLKDYRDEKTFFRKSTERIKKSGAELIVIDGPMNPRLNTAVKRLEPVWLRYNEMVREASKDFGFTYIDRHQLPVFGAEEFVDVTHVNWSGRERLSQLIAEKIVEHSQEFRGIIKN